MAPRRASRPLLRFSPRNAPELLGCVVLRLNASFPLPPRPCYRCRFGRRRRRAFSRCARLRSRRQRPMRWLCGDVTARDFSVRLPGRPDSHLISLQPPAAFQRRVAIAYSTTTCAGAEFRCSVETERCYASATPGGDGACPCRRGDVRCGRRRLTGCRWSARAGMRAACVSGYRRPLPCAPGLRTVRPRRLVPLVPASRRRLVVRAAHRRVRTARNAGRCRRDRYAIAAHCHDPCLQFETCSACVATHSTSRADFVAATGGCYSGDEGGASLEYAHEQCTIETSQWHFVRNANARLSDGCTRGFVPLSSIFFI